MQLWVFLIIKRIKKAEQIMAQPANLKKEKIVNNPGFKTLKKTLQMLSLFVGIKSAFSE